MARAVSISIIARWNVFQALLRSVVLTNVIDMDKISN